MAGTVGVIIALVGLLAVVELVQAIVSRPADNDGPSLDEIRYRQALEAHAALAKTQAPQPPESAEPEASTQRPRSAPAPRSAARPHHGTRVAMQGAWPRETATDRHAPRSLGR